MSEVHRYKVQCMFSEGGSKIEYFPHGPSIVMAEAFDAQRLRADTAEAELKKLRSEHFKEAVACVFDNLKMVACNTDDRAWDDRLEDLAEDVIEMAPEYKKEWKDIGDLCHKLAAAEQRIAELSELLKRFFEFVEMAPVSSGVCCCGSDTSQANHGDHMAVDQWDHSVSLWGREIDAALNQKSEGESQ